MNTSNNSVVMDDSFLAKRRDENNGFSKTGHSESKIGHYCRTITCDLAGSDKSGIRYRQVVQHRRGYTSCRDGIYGMNLGEMRNLTVKYIQIHCTVTYSMAVGAVVGYTWAMWSMTLR